MEAVAVEKPPVSDRPVSVISHHLHSNAGHRAVNLHRAGDISKLLVVVLMITEITAAKDTNEYY